MEHILDRHQEGRKHTWLTSLQALTPVRLPWHILPTSLNHNWQLSARLAVSRAWELASLHILCRDYNDAQAAYG
jgi:hypothetical protein